MRRGSSAPAPGWSRPAAVRCRWRPARPWPARRRRCPAACRTWCRPGTAACPARRRSSGASARGSVRSAPAVMALPTLIGHRFGQRLPHGHGLFDPFGAGERAAGAAVALEGGGGIEPEVRELRGVGDRRGAGGGDRTGRRRRWPGGRRRWPSSSSPGRIRPATWRPSWPAPASSSAPWHRGCCPCPWPRQVRREGFSGRIRPHRQTTSQTFRRRGLSGSRRCFRNHRDGLMGDSQP